MNDPVVTFSEVEKRYGTVAAIGGLSLQAKEGEIFGLVGPDGSGKTTLLEMLCGLRRPTSGEIRIFGRDPVRESRAICSDLGVVSQDFNLYGVLSVDENLDFFAELHGVAKSERDSRKKKLLSFARMEPFRDRRAEHLSGGMQKKLALCCSLIHEPRLLVLDEPTTGVDPVSRRDLWRIVFGFSRKGITVVVSTPYMDEAEQCHRVALLAGGRLFACGTPDELRRLIDGEMILVRAHPVGRVEAAARKVPGFLDSVSFGDRVHLRVESGNEFLDSLPDALARAGVELEEIRRVEPTLEDVFLAVTRKESPATGGAFRTAVEDGSETSSGHSGSQVVRVERLTRRFGDFVAVDNVSFSLREGEIFGLLGPNGAGKTTVIRMLCGLLRPSEGLVRVAGADPMSHPEALKSRIGYVSQRFSLYPDLTVQENLELYCGIYGVAASLRPERIAWVLQMAGLAGRGRWLASDLSGGFRQRLALGAALLHDPGVVFLDEPTSGVDPASRKSFWELIYSLAERGTTILVTTHYMDEAEHCHRLALMYRGRIIAKNSPQGLRRSMRAGELLAIECDRPLEAMEAAEREPYVWQASLFGKVVHILVDEAERDGPLLVECLRRSGVTVRRMEPVVFSLEDLFVTFVAMEDQAVKRGVHE